MCRDTLNCAATFVYDNRAFDGCDSKNSIAASIGSILGEISRVEVMGEMFVDVVG